MIFSFLRSYIIRKSPYVHLCLFNTDDQSPRLQMRTLFSGRILVHHRHGPTWRFHTELGIFLRNISTNICSLGKRTNLKPGEGSSLFISYKTTIFWLYPLNSLWFIALLLSLLLLLLLLLSLLLFYCVTVKTIYTLSLSNSVPPWFQFAKEKEEFCFCIYRELRFWLSGN